MKTKTTATTPWSKCACTAVLLASLAGTAVAQSTQTNQPVQSQSQPANPVQQDKQVQSVQGKVDAQTGKQAASKSAQVREDALAALQAAQHALRALDKGEADEALAALETAIGKLQIILARSPDLALAPVGADMTQLDVLASPQAIRDAIKDVEKLLKKGRVQDARHMLSLLGSEIVIHETSVPLATFPDALANIAPLIDQGKLDTARTMLAQTLSTLVVTDHVIPLPLVRADAMLEEAGKLAAIASRTEEQSKKLADMLDSIDNQIEMARLLGYGEEDDYKALEKEMKTIREKTRGKGSAKGLVDRIRAEIKDMQAKLFG